MKTFCSYVGYLVVAIGIGTLMGSLISVASLKIFDFTRDEGFAIFKCVFNVTSIATCAWLYITFEE